MSPISIAGSGTITGISAGGLPDDSVTTAELAAGAVTPAKLSTGAPTWDTSSRVGIGTTTVTDKLTLAHSDATGITFKATGTDGATSAKITFEDTAGGTGGVLTFDHNDNSFKIATAGTTERARIDSSGQFCLGATGVPNTPRLAVRGNADLSSNQAVIPSTYCGVVISSTSGGTVNNGGALWFDHGDLFSGIAGSRVSTSNWGTDLRFYTHPDSTTSQYTLPERMRIDSTGNARFSQQNFSADVSSTNYGFVIQAGSQPFINHAITGTSLSTMYVFINGNGVVGTIRTTGSSTQYNTSSDYRLKENVEPITDASDRLLQLKPSRFNFIADASKTVDGFIAHEVQEVVPEAISGDKDAVDDKGDPDYQGIDQSKLVPLLTAALQEAIGRIETLEAEVALLKGGS
jgi:hypothetical protein